MSKIKDTKIVRMGGKKYTLPSVLYFSKFDTQFTSRDRAHFYKVVGFREPKAGEYFLSGATVSAYYAKNDIPSAYLIAEPTAKAVRVTTVEWQEA